MMKGMINEDVDYCPQCGSSSIDIDSNCHFLWVCECGAKFEVSYYDKDFPNESSTPKPNDPTTQTELNRGD